MSVLRKIIGFPFALLWDLVTLIRNRLFDEGVFTEQSFDLPVIGVGNLTVGGTGKTPHVEYILRLLANNEEHPAVLSRGYKRKTSGYRLVQPHSSVEEVGDEPLQHKIKHPSVAVAVCENRVLGIPQLLKDAPKTTVVVLDDSYQHRWVKPTVNILLTDFHHRYTNDYLLPAGNLRESKRGAKRAQLIVVTKCPSNLSAKKAKQIEDELQVDEHQHLYFSYLHYGQPYSFFNQQEQLQHTDYDVVIMTGIARPNYLKSYVDNRYRKAYMRNHPDHHEFTARDIHDLHKLYQNVKKEKTVVMVTEKDAVKLLAFSELIKELNLPVFVQPIQVAFLFQKGQEFNEKLVSTVQNAYI